jgi:hypothetical protein
VRVTTAQRRARLGRRQFLAPGHEATDAGEVAGGMAGLHSSDPTTVYLSAWSRVPGLTVADLKRALYDDRSLVRVLGMRRTMFVVPTELWPVLHHACALPLAAGERKRLVGYLENEGPAEPGGGEVWLDRVEAATVTALRERGQAPARELTADVPDLKGKITFGRGKDWEGAVGISTRLLFLLATEGRIVRGRPLGSWISSQYRWAPTDLWLDEPIADLPTEEARARLLARWLYGFGPGTITDLTWWTGWGKGVTRRAAEAAGAAEVDLDDGTGYLLNDDLEPVPEPEPWTALLPSLDPTAMGWKERGWYVGDHTAHLFDRNGNIGPTVWNDGRIVGAWTQRSDGEIAYRLLEDVGGDAEASIAARAGRLEAWLGDTRFTARFPTPLERELRS